MVLSRLREDIATILEKDPAARSWPEVLCCYPGLHAVMIYRLAHPLWQRGWRFLPRFLSHVAKVFTGVEIHPGACIGRRLFIDHATGVVIGETAEVGDDVTLYQGVTLGGTSLHKGKRHPTLRDGVIVGSGGQVLGPIFIGAEARVGANAVVLADVPSGATVVGIPARVVRRDKVDDSHHCEFQAYGTPTDGIPDPVARTITMLTDQIGRLAARVEDLEAQVVHQDHAPDAGEPVALTNTASRNGGMSGGGGAGAVGTMIPAGEDGVRLARSRRDGPVRDEATMDPVVDRRRAGG